MKSLWACLLFLPLLLRAAGDATNYAQRNFRPPRSYQEAALMLKQ
jgi:hypothetical protein